MAHEPQDKLTVFLGKKEGEFIKLESESEAVIGLKIPRDYLIRKGDLDGDEIFSR